MTHEIHRYAFKDPMEINETLMATVLGKRWDHNDREHRAHTEFTTVEQVEQTHRAASQKTASQNTRYDRCSTTSEPQRSSSG